MAMGPGRWPRLGRVWRRVALVGILVGAAALSPTIAWATFTGNTSSHLTAGSATLAAPASITLSATCPKGNGQGGNGGSLTVTFPNVTRATSYQVVLDPPMGSNVTMTTTSGTTGATFTLTRTGSYAVAVTSLVQNWTSTATTRTFTC